MTADPRRLPLWAGPDEGTARRAEMGDQDAAKTLRGVQQAEVHRARVAASLSASHVEEVELGPALRGLVRDPDLPRADGWEICRGSWVRTTVLRVNGCRLEVDGRPVRPDWQADPQRSARAIGRCGICWGIHHTGAGWGEHPETCGTALCPACVRRAAGKRAALWAPFLYVLAAAGYRLVFLTLTQPVRDPEEPAPVVLSAVERLKYKRINAEVAGPGETGRAVPGDSLPVTFERLTGALRNLRDGSSRDWWARTVAGAIYGVETTGRSYDRKNRRHSLRWHTHMHALVLLKPEAEVCEVKGKGKHKGRVLVRGPWWEALMQRWGELCPGMDPKAQVAYVVSPDRVEDEVREVLKYPCKLGGMTDAQLADFLCTMKGRHWHGRWGCLHGSARVMTVARWLIARGRDGVAGRRLTLELLEDDGVSRAELETAGELGELELGTGTAEEVSELLELLEGMGEGEPGDLSTCPSTARALSAWCNLDASGRQMVGDIVRGLLEALEARQRARVALAYREATETETIQRPDNALEACGVLWVPLRRQHLRALVAAGEGDEAFAVLLRLPEATAAGEWVGLDTTASEVLRDLVVPLDERPPAGWRLLADLDPAGWDAEPAAPLTQGGIPDGSPGLDPPPLPGGQFSEAEIPF